ncbi:deoxynucleoside kinase-like isoform X2 [Pseudomyrmex gracilis]|uniref:deoxynucleoside kinase-like isoform X2 n=1 Tax=Pseudomyrmex gracilis TaxID=219809 RepID=UPI0009958B78|nr:deoxynucleoside kinase-like isoform X2 [Pseudomyrmex gracilis]
MNINKDITTKAIRQEKRTLQITSRISTFCLHKLIKGSKAGLFTYTITAIEKSCRHINTMVSSQELYTNPITIYIEGNIGSGKTTFLTHFQKIKDATILEEPVSLWQNVAGVNLLSYAQLTRLQFHTMSTPSPYKIMERSIFSSRIFLENMKRTSMIRHMEAEILEQWYNWCMENTKIRADLIVYLRTSPEVVYQRMQARGRKEENSVSLEYLKQIHELHDDWLVRRTLFSVPAPVMIVDGDKSLEEMVPQFEKCKDRILSEKIDDTSNTRIVLNTKA